jgi:prepilin-type processing-associated H-X9-DG protein
MWIDTSNKITKFRNSSNDGWTQGSLDITGNATISGDLTINGTTTTLDTTNLLVEDPLVILARNVSGTPAFDAGLIVERGSSTNVGFIWDESADEFAVINTTDAGTTAGNVTIASYANIQASSIAGTLTTAAQTNITSVGTLGSLAVSGSIDLEGDIDVNGTANLDIVDIDGAVNLASTLTLTDAAYFRGSPTYGFRFNNSADSINAMIITNAGDVTATTFNATGDTAAGDNAAIGYTSAEGLILTGQGSTSDITFKNDADTTVMSIKTGTGNVGIGTTSPAYALHHVNAGADTAWEIQTTGAAYGAELRLNSGGVSPAAYVTGRGSGTENWRIGSNSQNNTLELKTGANAISHFTFDGSGAVYNDDSADLDFRVESNGNANMLFVDGGNDRVGIGTTSPAATLDVTATDAMIIPKGTTVQRPGTPESGMMRFNTTTSCFEGYNGSSWINLGSYN